MEKQLLAQKLEKGDVIGVVASSRPIYTRKDELEAGLRLLKNRGYKVKLSKNINKQDYYSAGSAQDRADDLNNMFADPEVKAIICATGGISSNQILELIDYDLISKNPKIFIGYSDNTNPLLAINKKTGLVCFYGPDICELPFLSQEALESFLKFLTTGVIGLPGKIEVIKKGKEAGKLVGGYLPAINGLMTSEFSPKFSGSVLFWENVNESPAKIDFLLNQLKLSGNLKKISAMVVGHLENCVDAKYQQDNKQIEQIVLEVCKNYDFPIIKVDFFGHEIKDFYCLPIGAEVLIDTESKVFKISSEVLK